MAPTQDRRCAVFVDYDGTITDHDTFDVLVNTYVDASTWGALEAKLEAGAMTLRDVLATQASFIRASLDEADALLARETVIDPAFRAFAGTPSSLAVWNSPSFRRACSR